MANILQQADGANIMPPSIEAAKAGVTTGEWAAALRDVFGEYRAPTGVPTTARQVGGDLEPLRARVQALALRLGRPPALLVGKPGLDGHSNGAEQIAIRARDAGFDVTYGGIRLSAAEIVAAAVEQDVHCVGLSVLSGAHLTLARDVLDALRAQGRATPVVVGGIIPDGDAEALRAMGVARVYTPKDFDLSAIVDGLVTVIDEAFSEAGGASSAPPIP
ncbi:MAG TPA: cobalamin-dependent protein [Beijerinckiaceae bacterium]